MGERQSGGPFEVDFNSSVKMLFVGAQVTSDTGLLAGRELDERLGLTDMAAGKLWARRSRSNIQHTLQGLLRQSVYARIAAYEDTNDADQRQFGQATARAFVSTCPRKPSPRCASDGHSRGHPRGFSPDRPRDIVDY